MTQTKPAYCSGQPVVSLTGAKHLINLTTRAILASCNQDLTRAEYKSRNYIIRVKNVMSGAEERSELS